MRGRFVSRLYRIVLIVLTLLIPVVGVVSSSETIVSQDLRSPRYFDETGFWVQGSFREYWETHGGLFIFGYPITSVFRDSDGLFKQYFERSIFEFHPELIDTQFEVLLQRLGAIRTEGREAEEPFLPLQDITPDENCDFLSETGHRLCFAFKSYWYTNGGLSNFGFPVSEEFDERNDPVPAGDGNVYTVQYFERARFEYHPEFADTQYAVQLGLLGTEYLVRNGAPAEALARQPADQPPFDLTSVYGPEPDFGYGFNVAWQGDVEADAFHEKTFYKVNEAGFHWVRLQIAWSEFERMPGFYDLLPIRRAVDIAKAHNLHILASVVKAPAWATSDGSNGIPEDSAPFGAFMEHLAHEFIGEIEAYEIWNEQNLAHETGGFVTLETYVELLKAGYNGVKAGDPKALVVFGGLTPNGVNDPTIAIDDVLYLEQIFAHNNGEIRDYYDVMGVHPGSNNNHPDQMWPENPGPDGWTDHGSFYFRRVEEIREVMVLNDEAEKPIWLTEFGWTTDNPAPGYEYGADISEAEQAEYLVRAFEIAKEEWPWVEVMFVWNLNFSVVVDEFDEKGPWSVLYSDWSHRPSYDALKAMPK